MNYNSFDILSTIHFTISSNFFFIKIAFHHWSFSLCQQHPLSFYSFPHFALVRYIFPASFLSLAETAVSKPLGGAQLNYPLVSVLLVISLTLKSVT